MCRNGWPICKLKIDHLNSPKQLIQLHIRTFLCRELSYNNFDDDHCAASVRNLNNLIDLRLNHNKLTRVPVFVGLVSLQTLELANNEIHEISNESLMALPQLTHLDLSRNLIHTIAPNTFFKGNVLQKL